MLFNLHSNCCVLFFKTLLVLRAKPGPRTWQGRRRPTDVLMAHLGSIWLKVEPLLSSCAASDGRRTTESRSVSHVRIRQLRKIRHRRRHQPTDATTKGKPMLNASAHQSKDRLYFTPGQLRAENINTQTRKNEAVPAQKDMPSW